MTDGFREEAGVQDYLERTESYLRSGLLPFWTQRIVEPEHGGFQTNYDRRGERTSVTRKTLLCQARAVYALSFAARCGYSWDGWEGMIGQGLDFIQRHLRDGRGGGYYWIVEEDGRVLDSGKVVYGHAFLIYAFSEYALLTGDEEARRLACGIFDLLLEKASDLRYGGFLEHFDRDFRPVSVVRDGTLNKSFDVHMHLMEAFTNLYELTGDHRHRSALEQTIELICDRMIDGKTGTAVSLFRVDWTPMANEELETVWGADRFEDVRKPADVTSYGHNIEFFWLYLHGLDVLGRRPDAPASQPERPGRRGGAAARILPTAQHTVEHGVDREFGGIFVEGRRTGGPTDTSKEFWQQAEALVGFLSAYQLTHDRRFLDAFRNVHDFVFTHMINREVGEWYPLLSREGEVIRDYMGSDWKICYHTLRSMCLVLKKLREIINGESEVRTAVQNG